MSTPSGDIAVLTSGGVDSAILVADLARGGRTAHPIYIRFGLAWEPAEEASLRRYLAALPTTLDIRPLVVMELPIADVYDAHWSITADRVPDEASADDAVYLPGRNILLLAKTSVWCSLHGIGTIASGTLKGNPFADASQQFRDLASALTSLALGGTIEVLAPFSTLTKEAVMERGRDLPLQHSFSCIDPAGDDHCGRCNKCAERQKGFADAGIEDPTTYAA
jgi:7-cyano-7-deazaguanine synthase